MKLAQPHPGHELKQQIDASGFSQRRLAQQLNIAESQFNEILHGKRPLTPALCLALQRLFGLNAKLLNRKQADYDLEQARAKTPEAKPVDAEEQPDKPLVRVKAEAAPRCSTDCPYRLPDAARKEAPQALHETSQSCLTSCRPTSPLT